MNDKREKEIDNAVTAYYDYIYSGLIFDKFRDIFESPEKMIAYLSINGSRPQAEIAKVSGTSQPTISRLFKLLYNNGLIRDSEETGAAERVYNSLLLFSERE